jgi:hypothetical protein
MATLIAFATEDAELSQSGTTYTTVANGGGTPGIDSSSATARVGQQLVSTTYSVFQYAMRFDTSAIGTGAIKSAKASLFASANNNSRTWSFEVGHSKNWSSPIAASDWADSTVIHLDDTWNIAFSPLGTSAYTDFVWNPAGGFPNDINGAGNTDLIAFSIDQETLTAPTATDVITVFTVDQTGTTNDPKVTIVYGLFVKAVGAFGQAVTGNLSIPYPASPAAGNRFIAVITAQDNVVSSATGWTLKQGTNNGTGLRTEIWEKDAASAGTETGSVTWTRTSGAASGGQMLLITGASSATDCIEAAAASANTSSSTVTFPALTTISNGALVIAVQSIVGVATFGLPSGTDPTFVEDSDNAIEPRPFYLGATPVNSSSAATGFTLPIPSGIGLAVGDLVVLTVTIKSATGTTVTRSSGGGSTNPWSSLRAVQLNLSSSATATTMYYGHIIEAADIGASVVFAYTGGSVKFAVVASYWRNAAVLASQPNTSAAQANASATTATLPTVTPSVANCVQLAVTGTGDTVNISSITSFTVPAGAAATGSGGAASTHCGTAIAYKLYPASGSATGTSTVNLSGTSLGCATAHIVIAPANAASSPVSMEVADDIKTTAGLIASGRTATASVAGVNTGVLFAISPPAAPKSLPLRLHSPRFYSRIRRL